jgi:hypothetical protein
MVESHILIRQMSSLSKLFRDERTSYKTNNPAFDEVKDARITIFSKCIVVIYGAWICYMFRTFDLKAHWWDSIGLKLQNLGMDTQLIQEIEIPTQESDRRLVTTEFEKFVAYAYLLLLFSSIESSLRIIVGKVHPSKFRNSEGKFTGNFDDIARSVLSDYSKYENLLEFIRLLRNTNHTNGVYVSKKIADDNKPVSYNGKIYHFIDGRPIDLGNVFELFFFKITPDLLELIKDIVSLPDVKAQLQVEDPVTT